MDSVTWSVWHNIVMGVLSIMGGFALIFWGIVFTAISGLWKPPVGITVVLAGILLACHGVDHMHTAYLTHYFRILFPS